MEILLTIILKDMGFLNLQMEIYMKEKLKIIKWMEMECINIIMAKFIKVYFQKATF